MRSEKKDGVPLPLGGPGAITQRYLIKASLLGGEPLRPSNLSHTATSHVLQDGALTRESQKKDSR